MIDKLSKYFFYLFISIILVLLLLITFNSKLRLETLRSAVSAYKIYMIVSIQSDLKTTNTNIKSVKKKIQKYINTSNLVSNGKSSLLIGLYDVGRLVQSRIVNEEDIGELEGVFSQIVNLDKSLYEARIWYARSLSANKKIKEAYGQLDQAIKISPLDPDPYRAAINIALSMKEVELARSYCSKYLTNNLGGKKERYKQTIFNGYNLNKFGVRFNSTDPTKDKNDIYTFSGINLGEWNTYDLIPGYSLDITNFDLLFTIIKGTILEIGKIQIFSGNRINSVELKEVTIKTKNSFLLNENYKNLVVFTDSGDEIINVNFNKIYKNIDKILIEIKINKLSLLNEDCNM